MSTSAQAPFSAPQVTRRPAPSEMRVALFPAMDTFHTANLRASVAHRAGHPMRSMRLEKEKLREHRWQRGKLLFMDRMAADERGKRAYSQVCALRSNDDYRQELETRVQSENQKIRISKGDVPHQGPLVTTYSRHDVNHKQTKKYNWAPLEYY
eukprot:TRINITY_DN92770_c0_g1_i1.p1 TRINITY_DN92770_c0_g1~~TRINITY_DN92770_c0_g1_i1.p1  ORF type:complete len:153 (-),score=15.35 TRINITY_DN92770_c0_g1_i1:202-660(-)